MVEKNEQGKVLYSPDFKFFLEHQVMAVVTNNGTQVKLCSRLESRVFKCKDNVWYDKSNPSFNKHEVKTISDEDIITMCREVHVTLPHYK